MMQTRTFCLLIMLCLSLPLFAQNKEKEEIRALCESYIRRADSVLEHPGRSQEFLNGFATPLVIEMNRLTGKYYKMMGYVLVASTFRVEDVVLREKAASCLMRNDQADNYLINLEPGPDNWLVKGMNDHELTQSELHLFAGQVDSIEKEISTLDALCRGYFREMRAFHKNGSSNWLAENCAPLYWELLQVELERSRALDGLAWDYRLEEIESRRFESDTSARVTLIPNVTGTIRLELRKREGRWVIAGDKRGTGTDLANFIQLRKEQLAQLKVGNVAEEGAGAALTIFGEGVGEYFESFNSSKLETAGTPAMVSMVRMMKAKCGAYLRANFKYYGVEGFMGYARMDVVSETKVRYESLELSVDLSKTESGWKVTGFNGLSGKPDHAWIEAQFPAFKRVFKWSYSVFNQFDDDAEVVVSPSNSDKSRTVEGMDDLKKHPTFPGGGEAMVDWLRENDLSGFFPDRDQVYASFIVETDGSISNVLLTAGDPGKVLEKVSAILMKMPTWEAGNQYGDPVRVRWTIPLLPDRP